MPNVEDSKETNQKRTPGSRSGGFLFDLSLPPLVVVLVGFVMICVLSQVRVATSTPISGNDSQIAPLFTPEIQYWEQKIVAWGEDLKLDPNLIATVMQIESCGNAKARSNVGAMGLFQVMPYHFSATEDPYKPNTNARRGLAYLKRALDAGGGSTRLALAGYNGGITGAMRSKNTWPAETVRFVYWGTGIYSDAIQGKVKSERLDEWLAAGGSSLCKQAAENLGPDR